MSPEALFDALWDRHRALSPSAARLREALRARGETVVEDHIAFRTFDVNPISLAVLAQPWLSRGWTETGRYTFVQKKLRARSYSRPGYPRVFVSELVTEQCSALVREVAGTCAASVDILGTDLLLAGRIWAPPDRATYDALRAESEYAAWTAAFGFVANHFTVSVGALTTFNGLAELNTWVLEQGLSLNESGGAIKGSADQGLQQSSTRADLVPVELSDGRATLPGCYTEFAQRFGGFDGFIQANADRIFESTDASTAT